MLKFSISDTRKVGRGANCAIVVFKVGNLSDSQSFSRRFLRNCLHQPNKRASRQWRPFVENTCHYRGNFAVIPYTWVVKCRDIRPVCTSRSVLKPLFKKIN